MCSCFVARWVHVQKCPNHCIVQYRQDAAAIDSAWRLLETCVVAVHGSSPASFPQSRVCGVCHSVPTIGTASCRDDAMRHASSRDALGPPDSMLQSSIAIASACTLVAASQRILVRSVFNKTTTPTQIEHCAACTPRPTVRSCVISSLLRKPSVWRHTARSFREVCVFGLGLRWIIRAH